MYLIVGLGNPGREYAGTRHNVGFSYIAELADRYRIRMICKEHLAITGTGTIAGEQVVLAMPQTYMNLSGQSVKRLVDAYKINVETELIVAYDDMALDLGRLRIRKKGSAGGHNGIKNIIAELGTEKFNRIRLGIGSTAEGGNIIDFVLGSFGHDEQEDIRDTVSVAADATVMMMKAGPDAAMSKFNPYRKGAEEDEKERQAIREKKEHELMEARLHDDEEIVTEDFHDPEEFSKPYRYDDAAALQYRDDTPDDEPEDKTEVSAGRAEVDEAIIKEAESVEDVFDD